MGKDTLFFSLCKCRRMTVVIVIAPYLQITDRTKVSFLRLAKNEVEFYSNRPNNLAEESEFFGGL